LRAYARGPPRATILGLKATGAQICTRAECLKYERARPKKQGQARAPRPGMSQRLSFCICEAESREAGKCQTEKRLKSISPDVAYQTTTKMRPSK
jgi:hypothetical protein